MGSRNHISEVITANKKNFYFQKYNLLNSYKYTIMRKFILICCLGLAYSAPQSYSDQPAADLSDDTYATIQEVFQTSEKQVDASGYSNNNAPLTDSNVDVLVQVIKEADSQYPADYTEQFGYMCVPYYQCSNGTIITDGAGLIDI